MESYCYIRKLLLFGGFFSYICGLRDAGILDDLIIKTQKLICWKTISFACLALANGLASRRKLQSWVYLRFRLDRRCVHLRYDLASLRLLINKFVVDVSF